MKTLIALTLGWMIAFTTAAGPAAADGGGNPNTCSQCHNIAAPGSGAR